MKNNRLLVLTLVFFFSFLLVLGLSFVPGMTEAFSAFAQSK